MSDSKRNLAELEIELCEVTILAMQYRKALDGVLSKDLQELLDNTIDNNESIQETLSDMSDCGQSGDIELARNLVKRLQKLRITMSENNEKLRVALSKYQEV